LVRPLACSADRLRGSLDEEERERHEGDGERELPCGLEVAALDERFPDPPQACEEDPDDEPGAAEAVRVEGLDRFGDRGERAVVAAGAVQEVE